MKISELVRIKKKLLEFQSPTFATFIESKFKETSLYIDNMLSSFVFGELQSNLAGHLTELGSHITKTDELIANLISYVENLIEEQEKEFYKEGYLINGIEFISETNVHNERQYRTVICDDDVKQSIISDIRRYTNPKYPALEIGCRDGEWTKHLVASDPLYIADINSEFIDNTAQKFTPEYQARLRRYLIDITDYNISNLPTEQFNFIFSFNFFNYLSLDTIKQLLKRAMTWLRPGGVVLFTYNNADMSPSAGLSEGYFMTYVPKSLLIPMVESLGYEVITSRDFEPSTSWIELKKPGTLSTVKAHQALGEIKYR